jgi:hypothetical protein
MHAVGCSSSKLEFNFIDKTEDSVAAALLLSRGVSLVAECVYFIISSSCIPLSKESAAIVEL